MGGPGAGSMSAAPEQIVRIAARIFDVPAHQIYGPSRKRPIALARQATYEAISATGRSDAAVGRILDRDPTTVRHGIRQAANLATCWPDFAERRTRLAVEVEALSC